MDCTFNCEAQRAPNRSQSRNLPDVSFSRRQSRRLLAVAAGFAATILAAPNRGFGQAVVTGSVSVHFVYDNNGVAFYQQANSNLNLSLPTSYAISVDPSKLGTGLLNWSNPTTWGPGPTTSSGGINFTANGPVSGVLNSVNVLQGGGPVQRMVSTTFTVNYGGGNPGSVQLETTQATADPDVTLQSTANVVMDQYALTLHSLTVNSGAALSGTGSMIVQHDLANHGLFTSLSGSVNGNFINDGNFASGNYAVVGNLTLLGQLQNTGQIQLPGPLTLQAPTANAGTLIINGGSLITADVFTNNGTMQLSAGSLNTAAGSSNAGNFQWSGGNVGGNFTNTSANFSITGPVSIVGGTLNNTGTITQGNLSSVAIFAGGVLNNQAGGIFNILDDSGANTAYGSAAINNAGVFKKTGGTGTSTINVPVNNTGTLSATSGILSFNNGGTLTGGTALLANGASVQFAGGTVVVQGTNTASGNGSVTVSNGNVIANSSAPGTFANFTGGANLAIIGGSVFGDTGATLTLNLTGTSSTKMSGGSIGGAGSTINSGNFQWSGGSVIGNFTNTSSSFSITGPVNIIGGTLNNSGTITQGNLSSVTIFSGGSLNNQVGGIFNILDDSGIGTIYGTCVLNNTGLFEKTGGTGTSTINVPVNNTGTLSATSGILSFNNGGTLTGGTALLANSASVQFAGGTVVVQGTNTASGNGSVTVSNGNVVANSSAPGTFANFTNGANFVIIGGSVFGDTGATLTLNLTGTSSTKMSGGSIGGAGSTINSGNFQWSGGSVIGNFTNTSSSFSITGPVNIIGGTLNNSGTITQGNLSSVTIFSGGSLNNQVGGIFNILDDSGIGTIYGTCVLNNTGLFEKTGGTGTSTINVPVNNTGTLSATSGILSFNNGGTLTGGTALLANGASVQFAGGTVVVQGTNTASGNGSVTVSNGNVIANSSAPGTFANFTSGANLAIIGGSVFGDTGATLTLNLTGTSSTKMSGGSIGGAGSTINSGNFQWSGGSVIGNFTNTSSTFSITGPVAINGGTLTNSGTITQGGLSNVNIYSGGTLNNLSGRIYNIEDDSTMGTIFGASSFNNAGVLEKTGGNGTSSVAVPLNNTGTLSATSGILSFNNGGTLTGGTALLANGARVQFGGGTVVVQETNTASGNGSMTVSNGNVIANSFAPGTFANFTSGANLAIIGGNVFGDTGGTLTLNLTGTSAVQMSAGNIGGAGATINSGNFQWSGGNVAGNFTNTSSTFSITGSVTISGGTLNNSGTIQQSGLSSVNMFSTGLLNNQVNGIYNILDDSGFNSNSGSSSVNNSGLFEKSGGIDTSTVGVPISNTGTVQVNNGSLVFSGSVTQATGSTLTGGTWYVGAHSILNLLSAGPLTTNRATVGLTGINANFVNLNTLADNQGNFSVTSGAGFSTAGNLSNEGSVMVDPASSLTISGTFAQSATGSFHSEGVFTAIGDFTNSGNAIIGGSQNWSRLTNFNNLGGTAIFETDSGSAVTAPLSIQANGGIVTFSSTQHIAALTIADGAAVILSAPATHAARSLIVTGSLNFAGTTNAWLGKLDLNANDMVVQNGNLSTINNQVRSGYAGGSWTSHGITSSAAAHLTTLGTILNNDGSGHAIYGTGAPLGLFDGASTGLNDVLVKYTYFGDANLDGQVDGSDYTKIDNGFNNHLTGWFNGDFNYDGAIDGSDYTLIDNAFNTQQSSLASSIASLNAVATSQINETSAVPEPTTLGLLSISVVALFRRRRTYRENRPAL